MVKQILHILQMEAAMIIFIQIGQKIAAPSVIVGGGVNIQPAASAVIAHRDRIGTACRQLHFPVFGISFRSTPVNGDV